MKTIVNINNLPANANRFTYIVCREVEGFLWYFGAWYSGQKVQAFEQAQAIGGIVVKNEED